jgi:PPOX class probable F420-dependent enzyme
MMTTGSTADLAKAQYIRLTTFRKSGAGVPTPVWFAESGGKLYVFTVGTSGKVKRIRANGRALVAACDGRGVALGPEYAARARVLPADQRQFVEELATRKYGLMKRGFDLLHRLNGSMAQRAYLEIELTGADEAAL